MATASNWNRYIDQPTQTGFSYDILVNGTLNQMTGLETPENFTDSSPPQNNTFLWGTFPSQEIYATANDTVNAAKAVWVFAQVWFQEFPDYHPNNNKISLFTESVSPRPVNPSGQISITNPQSSTAGATDPPSQPSSKSKTRK